VLVLVHKVRLTRPAAPGFHVDATQLLRLSFLAILSHPILDTLNTYGVRWLMPFSGRWFYGDALFIVDPWMWLVLGTGVIWTARGRKTGQANYTRAATLALTTLLVYAGSMWASGIAARQVITREIETRFSQPVRTIMAGPRPLTLLSRSYVAEQEDHYRVGTFRWLARPQVDSTILSFPRGHPRHPAYTIAQSAVELRRFLGWARFPTFSIERTGVRQYLVHAVDLRYARHPGETFGTVTIPVRLPRASSPTGDILDGAGKE
jgi:inner membrane protein